ncbi:hypothetical protein EMIT0215P_20396 [Pseudomonas serboccidentalis]
MPAQNAVPIALSSCRDHNRYQPPFALRPWGSPPADHGPGECVHLRKRRIVWRTNSLRSPVGTFQRFVTIQAARRAVPQRLIANGVSQRPAYHHFVDCHVICDRPSIHTQAFLTAKKSYL